jgi:hypothetical protein
MARLSRCFTTTHPARLTFYEPVSPSLARRRGVPPVSKRRMPGARSSEYTPLTYLLSVITPTVETTRI